MLKLLHLFTVAAVLTATVSCTTTRSGAGTSTANPDALPQDPSVEVVTLDNGLTCWLKKHQTPPGKVTMWLKIHSGSLNEDEQQRGLAHFLEHMAFNGTANFPPGKLVEYFESLGMQFGRHQNAFTSFDQTTYQLTLPNTKPETVQKGLLCLSDYAFRMSLLPEEIAKERKVVLEEMRARDGVGKRISDKTLPYYAPGSRLTMRKPIGLKKTIDNADKKLIESYYRKWYRPDKATLMVVGDIDVAAVTAQIRKEFADWKKPAAQLTDYDAGITSYTTQRSAIITDPEYKQAQVMIATVEKGKRTYTKTEHRQELVEDLGFLMLRRRLSDMAREGKAPFQGAGAGKGFMFNSAFMTSASAQGKPEKAREMLDVLTREITRAKAHGFLQQELDQVVKATLSSLEQSVKSAATRNARGIVGQLNYGASNGLVPMSPDQNLELTKSQMQGITLAEINAAFKKLFPSDRRLVMAILPDDHKTGLTDKELLTVVQKAEAAKVDTHTAATEIKKLLDKTPTPGTWVKVGKPDPDLGVVTGTLSNGVVASFREMDYKKNLVQVRITIVGGEILEDAKTKGWTQAAARVFGQHATKKYTSKQISDFFVGKKVSVGGGVFGDTLMVTISGAPEDLETGFQLAHLLLTEPKIEKAAIDRWRTQTRLQYKATRTVAEGRLFEEMPKLASNDPRLHVATPDVLDKITLLQAQKWLEQQIAQGFMEVGVVGDIKKERAMDLVKTYIGSLPQRRDNRKAMETVRKVKTAKGPITKIIPVNSIAQRAAVFVGWQVPGWEDVDAARKLNLASMVLQKRIREEIREKKGLTYSAAAFYRSSRALQGTSIMGCFLTADPMKAKEALEACRKVFEDFAKTGPTADELNVVQKQMDNNLDNYMKQPGFWVGKLAELEYRGLGLDYYKTIREDYKKFSTDDIKAITAKHFVDANRMQIIATTKAEEASE